MTTPAAAPTPDRWIPRGPDSAPPAWVRPTFRVLAFAEALSWAALLVAMFFKWILKAAHEGGVPVVGPIHGGFFLAYVAITIIAWVVYRWSPKVGLLALASSIPPFATVVFEVLADRRGLLGVPRRTTST